MIAWTTAGVFKDFRCCRFASSGRLRSEIQGHVYDEEVWFFDRGVQCSCARRTSGGRPHQGNAGSLNSSSSPPAVWRLHCPGGPNPDDAPDFVAVPERKLGKLFCCSSSCCSPNLSNVVASSCRCGCPWNFILKKKKDSESGDKDRNY